MRGNLTIRNVVLIADNDAAKAAKPPETAQHLYSMRAVAPTFGVSSWAKRGPTGANIAGVSRALARG